MTWFYLALLAPFFYAIVNLFDDNLLRYVYKNVYMATVFAGLFGAVPLAALIFKAPHITVSLAALSVLAGFLTTTYYHYYFKGLESDSPSVVITLFNLAPATIPIFAYFLVDERLRQVQILGFLIVLIASVGMAATDLKKFKFSKALVPVIMAVIYMDVVSLILKYVYQETSFFGAYMFFCYPAYLVEY